MKVYLVLIFRYCVKVFTFWTFSKLQKNMLFSGLALRRFSQLVAMSGCLSLCLFVCLSVCAIAKHTFPEVVETFGPRTYSLYLPVITKFSGKNVGFPLFRFISEYFFFFQIFFKSEICHPNPPQKVPCLL